MSSLLLAKPGHFQYLLEVHNRGVAVILVGVFEAVEKVEKLEKGNNRIQGLGNWY